MHPSRNLPAALILLVGLIATPASVRAAQDYDNCTGFITSLPTTITTSGTWCLSQDLSTAIITGNAITINTNNVTIDCNDFKLGGLTAGAGTQTRGIYTANRLNATVRHCNIRGFFRGVGFLGESGGGHVIEDNRFNGNTYTGIFVEGHGSVVRRNLVRNTGGSTASLGTAIGIYTFDSADVLDNTVNGVLPTADAGNATAYGIYTTSNFSGSVSGNRVRALAPLGIGGAFGIYSLSSSSRTSLDGNHLGNNASAGSFGLSCPLGGNDSATNNIISGFATGISADCDNDGGNVIKP